MSYSRIRIYEISYSKENLLTWIFRAQRALPATWCTPFWRGFFKSAKSAQIQDRIQKINRGSTLDQNKLEFSNIFWRRSARIQESMFSQNSCQPPRPLDDKFRSYSGERVGKSGPKKRNYPQNRGSFDGGICKKNRHLLIDCHKNQAIAKKSINSA